jgi:hypothetical protein
MSGVIFLPDKHQYFIGEIELPSVTHICRFLSYDMASGANIWLRDVAAARGTEIHEICEAIDYGMTPELIRYDMAPYISAYMDFLRDYQIKGWQGIELVMGDLELGFAGTADRLGEINSRMAIMDIKTGSTLHRAPLSAQLTGYAILHEKLHGYIPKLYALHLKKDGKYTLRKVDFNAELWAACMTMQKSLQPKRRNRKS